MYYINTNHNIFHQAKWKEEVRDEGLKEGREKDREEKNAYIIRKMQKLNYDLKSMEQITGLDQNSIQKYLL